MMDVEAGTDVGAPPPPPTLASALTDTLTDLGVFVDGHALDLSTAGGVRETAATVAEEVDPAAFRSRAGDDANPAGVDARLAAAAAGRGHIVSRAAAAGAEGGLPLLSFLTADLAATRLAAAAAAAPATMAATGVAVSAGAPLTAAPAATATEEDAQLAAAVTVLSAALVGSGGGSGGALVSRPSSPPRRPSSTPAAVADALTIAAAVAAATPGLPATRPPVLDAHTVGGLTAAQTAAIDRLAARLDAEYAERVATLLHRAASTVAAMGGGGSSGRRGAAAGDAAGGATTAAPLVSLPPLDGGVAARLMPLALPDAAAATDALLVVERVTARGGAPAGAAVKRRLMGPVPDRGGRVDGAEEGGGGGGWRGGRGGRGGRRWVKRGGRGRGRGGQ